MGRVTLALGFVACATQPVPLDMAPPGDVAPRSTAAAPAAPPPVAPPASVAAETAEPVAPFRPADFAPMFERTAKPDDGKWVAMAEGKHAGGSSMFRSEVHPQRIKPHPFVTLVAFDTTEIALTLVPGTDEPESKSAPASTRTGLVPAGDHARLLVVFNGGFKTEHGHYGMMAAGQLFVPPKDDACAVALYRDGRIAVKSWPTLAGDADAMVAWRQTPPCLVEGGVLNERLSGEFRTRKWGAAAGGDREIRRSAVGRDASGRTLYYAFADWVSAGDLAAALVAAGVHDAAQLDINWSYTKFFTFAHDGAEPRIADTLVPEAKYAPNNYVSKPSSRDFFYVTTKR